MNYEQAADENLFKEEKARLKEQIKVMQDLVDELALDIKQTPEEVMKVMYGPRTNFGENSILNNKPRAGTVMAMTPVHIAYLNKAHFDKTMKRRETKA